MNLYKFVSDSINAALGRNAVLEIPKNREFGDFATNAAMVLAKEQNKNPHKIASEILPKIAALDFVANASSAGPGFINIRLDDEFILRSSADTGKIANPAPQVIDLDYGSYNVGKALHVGHLRTTIVGDTYNRIARFLGHKTKSYNHLGDWGRPMGLVIAWILENGAPKNAAELDKIYPASTARANSEPGWLEHAKRITAQLQAGNPEYRKIYDEFMTISLSGIDRILKRLNVLPFDSNMGERDAAEYVPDLTKILEQKKLLKESDGALVISVRQDADNAPMPPLIFRSSADAKTYGATDLSAIYYMAKTDAPDKIIYWTDARQNLHFQQIFRAAKMAGLTDAELIHIGFGTVTGKDGKPFKTRDGDTAELSDILDMARDAVAARAADAGKNLPPETIDMIALAAVKFNDLTHDVFADYMFDPAQIASFEGRTGPYILYAAVRLGNVLKKSGQAAGAGAVKHELAAEERELLLALLDFEHAAQSAFDKRNPSLLANYAYDLAQSANAFYHSCPILRDDIDEATRRHRLQIAAAALNALARSIDLMGLEIPEEM